MQFLSSDSVACIERKKYFLCARGRVFRMGDLGKQDDEFVSALTAYRIGGADALKIMFPFTRTVLIFFIAGLLFIVLRARRTLGAYRIPRRPAFSSHLINAYRKLTQYLKHLLN